MFCFVFFKQKTAYEMRISDWSSDVCSSDLSSISQFESTLMTSVSSRGMLSNERKGIAMKCGGLPCLTMRELSESSISIMHTAIFLSTLESQTMIPDRKRVV